ncbi:MAG: hypothetical protein IJ695_03555 [Butyrivibrio sp.]|nr:hypothetical protein [Butyrivibrio sp.]
MDRRVLLIGIQKSFMVNAIAIGLQKADFVVETAPPDEKAIQNLQDKPGVYVLYLGDLTEEYIPFFTYINESIDSERYVLYLVGTTRSWYLRPP